MLLVLRHVGPTEIDLDEEAAARRQLVEERIEPPRRIIGMVDDVMADGEVKPPGEIREHLPIRLVPDVLVPTMREQARVSWIEWIERHSLSTR